MQQSHKIDWNYQFAATSECQLFCCIPVLTRTRLRTGFQQKQPWLFQKVHAVISLRTSNQAFRTQGTSPWDFSRSGVWRPWWPPTLKALFSPSFLSDQKLGCSRRHSHYIWVEQSRFQPQLCHSLVTLFTRYFHLFKRKFLILTIGVIKIYELKQFLKSTGTYNPQIFAVRQSTPHPPHTHIFPFLLAQLKCHSQLAQLLPCIDPQLLCSSLLSVFSWQHYNPN